MNAADRQAESESRAGPSPHPSALGVFTEALDVPAEDRGAFLEKACAGDKQLRDEVEDLLRHDATVQPEFLKPPPLDPRLNSLFRPDGPDPLIGRAIGAYTIRSVIARGGMGAVYLAKQQSPHRDVALKIMTNGFWSRSAQHRFEFETEILARLHHPNIAQVYESGVHRLEIGFTVPFFAMEYIPGAKPISEYCDEGRLDSRARLKLFGAVCDAVHHGHQKGVIHRDLKPGNVLVDEHGHVKVIDFGVAKSTDSDVAVTARHTDAGQLIGTLQYMSPEQAGSTGVSSATPADIDTRSDVYSLGVVLFELLTGRLPYDVSHMTIHAAARVICEREPTSLSKFDGRLRGDLEAIVLKALEKAPEKRYASVAALADDLRRYLSGELIAARTPTRWSRAVRWTTRHPFLVTAGASLLLGLGVLLGVALVGGWLLFGKPYEIETDRREGEAWIRTVRVRSYSGLPLRSWTGSSPEGQCGWISYADMREYQLAGERKRLLVLGFTSMLGSPYQPGLEVYDADADLNRVSWYDHLKDRDLPSELEDRRGFTPDQFGVWRALVADVFPQPDGSRTAEIIAVFKQRDTTNSVVRVYDLQGKILSQLWMDVQAEAIYWADGPQLLICFGLNGEATVEQRGLRDATLRSHPYVLFAIRLYQGFDDHSFLAQEATVRSRAIDELRPVWYKCLLPMEACDRVGSATLTNVGENRVRVDVCVPLFVESPWGEKTVGSLGWLLDASTGELVNGPIASEPYQRNQELPDGDPRKLPKLSCYLGDLPPIIGPTEPSLQRPTLP